MFKGMWDTSERVNTQNSHQEERHCSSTNYPHGIHCFLRRGGGTIYIKPSLQKGTQNLNRQSYEID